MDKQPSSRTCFVCGRQNPVGLKVNWYNDHVAQRVQATVTIPEHFKGYPGIVHGGIIATLLDETAGRSLLLGGDDSNLMVTLKLEVKYRKPVPTRQPVTLPDGTIAAEAEAILVRPPQEFFDRWEPEKPFWRVYED